GSLARVRRADAALGGVSRRALSRLDARPDRAARPIRPRLAARARQRSGRAASHATERRVRGGETLDRPVLWPRPAPPYADDSPSRIAEYRHRAWRAAV